MPNTLIWIPKRLVELGLVNVAARSPEAFIDYCEQDYAARVEHAAACVRESGAHVVMLTGPSASGKTTTAHKLADCIAAHGRRSAVVSLDNFYKDLKDYPRLPDGSVDYESVDALDISAINRCLLELIRTGRTQIPDFDFCGSTALDGPVRQSGNSFPDWDSPATATGDPGSPRRNHPHARSHTPACLPPAFSILLQARRFRLRPYPVP